MNIIVQLPKLLEGQVRLDFKFVVIRVSEGKYHLQGDIYSQYHSEIVKKSGYKNTQCMGGGRIELTSNKLRTYHHSIDFGTLSNDFVKSLLQEYCCEDNKMELVVEMSPHFF